MVTILIGLLLSSISLSLEAKFIVFDGGIGKFGEVLSDKLEIACKDNHSVKIIEIQREGKKPQKIGEFMLGSKIKKGSIIPNV